MKTTSSGTQQFMKNQGLSSLVPLLFGGIIFILCIIIFIHFQNAQTVPPKVMLPGGVTYLGQ